MEIETEVVATEDRGCGLERTKAEAMDNENKLHLERTKTKAMVKENSDIEVVSTESKGND